MIKLATFCLLVLAICVFSIYGQRTPDFERMKQVSQLPAEITQRAMALAFDGERFWVALYLDRARLVSFDPKTETWDSTQDPRLAASAFRVSGRFASPGGITFADGKMWFASSYGDSYGWIDLGEPEKYLKYEKVIRPDYEKSQSYTDLAFDGGSIWATWIATEYSNSDRSKTHLLLKIDPKTGEVVSSFPMPFGGGGDGAYGLAWDGQHLWSGYQNTLRAIDRKGKELANYNLKGIGRVSGIAWDGEALWLTEFEGKLWKLPMADTSRKSSN